MFAPVNIAIELIASLGIKDLIDIVLLTMVIYWLLQSIKGTRTIPMLLGLTVMLAAYGLAAYVELEAIGWLLESLFNSAVIILVVLFQGDVRNALAKVGISTIFREQTASARSDLIDEIVETARVLASQSIGGTIALEHETGLRNYIERGKEINARPTVDLFLSIFHTSSPLHDGAVIVDREGKLAAARCILPLSMNPVTSALLGTRHRSAIGLSEETDAIVVVISEERGIVSLVHGGKLYQDLPPSELRQKIMEILQRKERVHEISDPRTEAQPA